LPVTCCLTKIVPRSFCRTMSIFPPPLFVCCCFVLDGEIVCFPPDPGLWPCPPRRQLNPPPPPVVIIRALPRGGGHVFLLTLPGFATSSSPTVSCTPAPPRPHVFITTWLPPALFYPPFALSPPLQRLAASNQCFSFALFSHRGPRSTEPRPQPQRGFPRPCRPTFNPLFSPLRRFFGESLGSLLFLGLFYGGLSWNFAFFLQLFCRSSFAPASRRILTKNPVSLVFFFFFFFMGFVFSRVARRLLMYLVTSQYEVQLITFHFCTSRLFFFYPWGKSPFFFLLIPLSTQAPSWLPQGSFRRVVPYHPVRYKDNLPLVGSVRPPSWSFIFP